jgi:hypothetical protein
MHMWIYEASYIYNLRCILYGSYHTLLVYEHRTCVYIVYMYHTYIYFSVHVYVKLHVCTLEGICVQ